MSKRKPAETDWILTYYQHPKVCSPGSVDYVSSKNNIHVTYSFDGKKFRLSGPRKD